MQNSLPESVSGLREMVVELHGKVEGYEQEIEGIKSEIERYEVENDLLREQIRLLRQKFFGRKSEKYEQETEEMALLFAEWEDLKKLPPTGNKEEVIEVAGHNRKKPGRKPIPDHFPRVVVEHDLPDNEKMCGCGCMMSRIGEESSEQLEMTPASYKVIRHVRYKYACKKCEGLDSEEGAVRISPVPVQMIPKSIATSGLLSHIFVAKFCDAIPFYRQESQFARSGIEISRSTMCNWAFHVYERCRPLLEMLKLELVSGFLINADETTVQVLEEPGRCAESKSYMWVFRGGHPDRPVFYFHYHPTRGGEVAEEFLSGYKGYVQTDGYSGYNFLDINPGVIHVGCWAHVRRKFMEVIRAAGGRHGNGKADEAIKVIRNLYKIEKEVKDLQPEEILRQRQEQSKPILDKFEGWLKENARKTPPKSLLGKAFIYALSQWPRLLRYLEDGRVRIDNNLAENAIRPFVLGRKNWLFSGTPDGAKASAFFYSIIETAKANGLEPFSYLAHLFEKLPHTATTEDQRLLLPQHVDRNGIAASLRKK